MISKKLIDCIVTLAELVIIAECVRKTQDLVTDLEQALATRDKQLEESLKQTERALKLAEDLRKERDEQMEPKLPITHLSGPYVAFNTADTLDSRYYR